MKNIIFDFDGPLFDSRTIAQRTLQKIFKELQIPIILNIDGMSLSSPDKLIAASMEKYNLGNAESHGILDKYYEELKKNELLADVRENTVSVLRQLKEKNYRLFVVSDRSEQRLKRIMENTNILEYFDEVIGRDRFGLKPSQGSAEYLQEKYQILKEDTWMIGDTKNDYLYAKQAGYHYAQVLYSSEPVVIPQNQFDLVLNKEEDILKI